MPKIKVYQKDESGFIRHTRYCMLGFHMDSVQDGNGLGYGGVFGASKETVKRCDGSCKDKPTLQEIDISATHIESLREKLNAECIDQFAS